jgi:prepilin-type N-terminal cleavage/methylation domain-containing protein/prepilin-type processing-associated H-X9-DG protein
LVTSGIGPALAAEMDLKAQKLPRRAFTLVELLVVIAIVAILASLLAPTLSQAKTRAKNTLCKNNLRQVGLALVQYTATYDAYVPSGIWGPDSITSWDQLLGTYLGQPVVPFHYKVDPPPPPAKPPFLCPVYSAGMRNMPFDSQYRPQYSYNIYGTITHAGTQNGVVTSRFLGLGGGSFGTDANGNLMMPDESWVDTVRESDVVVPSEMLAFGDPFSRSEAPEYDGQYNFYDFNPVPKTYKHLYTAVANPQECQNAVKFHGAQFNRFYCDGHVEAENFKKPFVASDDYLARWNTDHQPHRDHWLRW